MPLSNQVRNIWTMFFFHDFIYLIILISLRDASPTSLLDAPFIYIYFYSFLRNDRRNAIVYDIMQSA